MAGEYSVPPSFALPRLPTQSSNAPSSAEPVSPAVFHDAKTALKPVSFSLSGARPRIVGRLNLSPDGRTLAYASGGGIYARGIDGDDTRLIASVNGSAGTPFWSPDGKSISFTANGRLYVEPIKSGVAKELAPIRTALAGAWGPDGTILIGEIGDSLFSVPSSGGLRTKVTTLDAGRGDTRHQLPQFLPGGKRFIYTAGSNAPGSGMLFAGSFDGSQPVPILQSDSGAVFVPRSGSKGYLVFTRSGSLLAQSFDAATLRVENSPIRIAGPIATLASAAAAAISAAEFSATSSTLVYRPAASAMENPLVRARIDEYASAHPMSEPVVIKNWMAALKR